LTFAERHASHVRTCTCSIASCLSNAMHRQNINLPVCVCPSHFLSTRQHAGQTPQRIFTVDSLKDADLRKDVPFVGLNDKKLVPYGH